MARQMEAALRDMASVAPAASGADTVGQAMRPAASGAAKPPEGERAPYERVGKKKTAKTPRPEGWRGV
jgi:hypothetical protein